MNSVHDEIGISLNNLYSVVTPYAGGLTPKPAIQFMVGYGGSSAHGPKLEAAMDELGFWKRLLTPEERAKIYNGGRGLAYPFTGSLPALSRAVYELGLD